MERIPTQSQRRFGNHCTPAALLGGVLLLALTVSSAWATHFRYGHITWKPRTDISATTVEFTVQNVWRRDAYGAGSNNIWNSGENACVNTSLARVFCTGPGGYAGVGDLIHEAQGGTTLDFGDGSSTFGTTLSTSSTKALVYLITSIDPANNWAFGLAIDHTSLPTMDTTIQRTYATGAQRTAKIEDCCRISACASPNAHLNNPDTGYRVTTVVDFSAPDSSPVSSVPPIVLCPQNSLCGFNVPVSDNEGDTVAFRLATGLEMNTNTWQSPGTGPGLGQPGAGGACTNTPDVTSGTGDYDWNTASCRLASSPLPIPPAGGCNNGSLHSYYSTQVFIEETAKPAESAVDFLIELLPFCPTFNAFTPAFLTPPTPLCGTARSTSPGSPLTFTVEADDNDASDSLSLNAVGLPAGAAMLPLLPTSGKPVSSAFSWTPNVGQLGQHIVTFTATDQCGEQALCAITIDVSYENCTDGIDNDGDSNIDCADLDCNGTPCDDGDFCTVSDTCQAGTCGAGPARDCSDGNQCSTDTCNEDTDQCDHAVVDDGTSCSDGAFCTQNDSCQAGTCTAGVPRPCSDGNSCTADNCNEGTDACENPPVTDGTSCSDGAFCTSGDTCQAGACAGGGPRNCSDNNSCTADTCDENADECVHDGAPLEGQTCSDGFFCTSGDTCASGLCGGAPLDCGDNNTCTSDSCDEASDQCDHDPVTDGTTCEDGAFCTTGESCQAGACSGGGATNCSDSISCTVDACDEDTDSCVHDGAPLEGTSCDDGLYCTVGDTCQSGACDGAARDCSDSNPCTADNCDENANECTNGSGPAASCHKSGRSTLLVRDRPEPKQDRIVWRWTRGNVPVDDVGDPVTGSTSYTLCVYDESADGATTTLALSTTVNPGGTCAGNRPCWKKFGRTTLRRVRYRDRDQTGSRRLVVKPHTAGGARVVFVSRGDRVPTLPAPAAPGLFAQDNKVRVQLVNSAGKCWEAEYNSPAIRNRTDYFRDKCGSGTQGTCP